MLMMYRGRLRSVRRGTPLLDVTRRRSTSGRLRPVVAVGAGIDPNLARLDLFRLRDPQGQHAVGERGVGPVTLDADGKLDAAAEGAIAALPVEVLVSVDLLIGLELAAHG